MQVVGPCAMCQACQAVNGTYQTKQMHLIDAQITAAYREASVHLPTKAIIFPKAGFNVSEALRYANERKRD